MIDKQLTLNQAAAQVPSGSSFAVGGLTIYRRPVAFVRSLIRRFLESGEPKDLRLLAFTAGIECDMLVGAGMVASVRSCYFGLEIFGLAPMFTSYANGGAIQVIEETEASLAFGLRAQMAGIGFMPGRGWIGTDLPTLRPDVRRVIDPYNGEELMAFPAIKPDVAVIHALRADRQGNAVIGDNKGVDVELAITADHVILTSEEIVPELEKADIVAPFVHAVCLAPRGASPTSCHPLYPLDGDAFLAYTSQVTDQASFKNYLSNSLSQPGD